MLQTFVHPAKAYRLEYPADWERLEEDNARSCGFGPRDRNDVGLWLSIMPMSVDTERLPEDLPAVMQQALPAGQSGELRVDPTLRHYGLVADIRKEGQAGHYWIVAGGDLVLFASSEVPAAERDVWNPLFAALMASLEITRGDELLVRQAVNEVLQRLREKCPEEDFDFDEGKIRGKNRVVYLGNLEREVRRHPTRREKIVEQFVAGLTQSTKEPFGTEVWDKVCGAVLPGLKPRDYIDPSSATRHLLTTEWLADVIICYVLRSGKVHRFLTGWDVDRWGLTAEIVHQQAIDNLARLPWPERMEGSRHVDGGRIVVISTPDELASSRLLHPDLHRLFSGGLGSPFWAGIPDRNTLVAFSDRKLLKHRTARTLKKDHAASAYPISPRTFLVTHDGIAPGPDL